MKSTLHLYNNGHTHQSVFGHGGLGYHPTRMSGRGFIEKDEDGNIYYHDEDLGISRTNIDELSLEQIDKIVAEDAHIDLSAYNDYILPRHDVLHLQDMEYKLSQDDSKEAKKAVQVIDESIKEIKQVGRPRTRTEKEIKQGQIDYEKMKILQEVETVIPKMKLGLRGLQKNVAKRKAERESILKADEHYLKQIAKKEYTSLPPTDKEQYLIDIAHHLRTQEREPVQVNMMIIQKKRRDKEEREREAKRIEDEEARKKYEEELARVKALSPATKTKKKSSTVEPTLQPEEESEEIESIKIKGLSTVMMSRINNDYDNAVNIIGLSIEQARKHILDTYGDKGIEYLDAKVKSQIEKDKLKHEKDKKLIAEREAKRALELSTNIHARPDFSITDAKLAITQYGLEKRRVKLSELKQYKNSKINVIVDKLEGCSKKLLDKPLPSLEKSNTLVKECVKQATGDKYLDTVNIAGKPVSRTTFKFYSKPKLFEYGICGIDNVNAMKLFLIQHPNFQVSDFIVEHIFQTHKKEIKGKVPNGAQGGQFCQDNIDITNAIINEMKYYEDENYESMYKLNIQLKEIYINELLESINNELIEYLKSNDESILDGLKIFIEILSNKDKFDKQFYLENPYLGIAITINKWNPVKIPKDFDFEECPNTPEQVEIIKSNQGQKYIPHMRNRHIISYEYIDASPEVKKLMTEELNKEIFKGRKFKFYITVGFSKCIGVYDYSSDILVIDDFILGTYHASYTHDKRGEVSFNSVLIPVEKFTLKG